MAVSNLNKQDSELVFEDQDVSLDLDADGLRRTTVVLPPVSKMKALHGNVKHDWKTVRHKVELSKLDLSIIRDELDRLLRNYERYRESASYLTRVASLCEIVGDGEAARNFAAKAVALSATSQRRYFRVDLDLNFNKDVNEAISELESLADEGVPDAVLRLAEIYFENSRVADAKILVFGLLEREPLDWRTNLLAGTIALVEGQHAEAIRLFRTAAEDRPNSTVLFTNLAIAHYAAGNVKQAIKAIRTSLGLNPLDPNALSLFIDMGVAERKALPTIARLVKTYSVFHPSGLEIVSRAANVFLEMKAYKEGANLLEPFAKSASDANLLNNYAVLLSGQGKTRPALANFYRAMQVVSKAKEDYDDQFQWLVAANAANTFLELNEPDEAQAVVEAFLSRYPDAQAIADSQLSRLKRAQMGADLQKGNFERVVEFSRWAREVNDIDPTFKVHLLTNLVCYHSIVEGDFETSNNLAWEALRIFQSLPKGSEQLEITVRNNLAYCLIETSRMGEAWNVLQPLRTKSLIESWPFAIATLGLFHIRSGATAEGVGEYRRAIAMARSHGEKILLKKKLEFELAKLQQADSPNDALLHLRRAKKMVSEKLPWPSKGLDREIAQMLESVSARIH